jgi:MHS family proline/betaine transporter-like MFS transporter
VWVARSAMQESPDFERQQADGTTPRRPLRHTMTNHGGGVLRAFAISALGSITYYVGITYVPAFLTSTGSLAESTSLWLSVLPALVVILVTPLAGLLTDRWGRKPVLVLFCLASTILPVTLFSAMASGSAPRALLGAVLLAAVAGGVSAVGAVATAEQFPGEGRLSGLALGTTTATAIFGGLTPWLAQLLVEHTGWRAMPGVMIAVVGLCVLPVFFALPETAHREGGLKKPCDKKA